MKIFFLINTLRSGGAQQALTSIVENLNKKNLIIYLIVIDKKNKIDSKVINKNLKVFYLNASPKNPFDVLPKIYNLLRILKPKYIVSTGNAETIIYSRLSSIISKTKHISWIQFDYQNSIPMSYFKKIIWTLFFKKLFFIDYKTVLISNYLKERYVKDLGWKKKKIIIIPNTFSKNCLDNFKKKSPKDKIILCPGRLDYDKNHIKIIYALKKFKIKYNNFKCLFIGEKGNAYNKIIEEIKKNKLEKNIKVQSYIKSELFLKILNNSYLVILVSKKEPFGVIALEAIYLKTNFIISRSSGFKDIIKGIKSRNIVNKYNRSDEIYKKMISLYTKPLNQFERNMFYKKILNSFESKNLIKKWENIFK